MHILCLIISLSGSTNDVERCKPRPMGSPPQQTGGVNMKIEKNPVIKQRIRKIESPFSWFPYTFLTKGFLASLSQDELLFYIK